MSTIRASKVPYLMEGGLAVDDRGTVAFVNDFSFEGVKRCYMVSNHRVGFVRAWHAHRREAKYIMVLKGEAIVAAVAIDDWDHPAKDSPVNRYILSEKKPAVLYVPPAYANGFMTLSPDTLIMFFSTSSLAESQGDDIRYHARYWDPWQVEER
jgi:dTDP-4-dehydrorhamnose 3,5-epimerase-like enzyme